MAKTYNNLFEAVTSRDNIERAMHIAARGKRHKRSVRRALADVDGTVSRIHELLVSGSYSLPSVRPTHIINDGINAKKRIIVHPSFTEQIVDHCLMNVLTPIFMRGFYRWSCGSIPGRGQESMVRYMMKKIRKGEKNCKYYAKLDVKKCFDSLDKEAVKRELRRYVRDRRVLGLLDKIADANVRTGADGEIVKGGVPIGLFTSPWFANLCLNPVDHIIKDIHAVYLYVRFMDDMLLVHGNRRELKRTLDEVVAKLAQYGLRLKEKPIIRRWVDGDRGKIRFCGVQITRSSCEVRDKVFIRAVRTARRIERKMREKRRVTWYDAAKIVSYGGRFRAFESYNAFVKNVLRGKIHYYSMREKISAHDKLKAKEKDDVSQLRMESKAA